MHLHVIRNTHGLLTARTQHMCAPLLMAFMRTEDARVFRLVSGAHVTVSLTENHLTCVAPEWRRHIVSEQSEIMYMHIGDIQAHCVSHSLDLLVVQQANQDEYNRIILDAISLDISTFWDNMYF